MPDAFAAAGGMVNPQAPVPRMNNGLPDMSAYNIQLNPAANLFSTIQIPTFQPTGAPPAGNTHTGGGGGTSDSAGLSDDKDDGGGGGRRGNRQANASVQEKNRRAQKRFRERQKAKMKDMTEHLEDMSTELSKLRVENNALKNRNNVLEKVLTLRDEHIRVMQDEQHVFDLGSPYLQTAASQKMITGGESSAPADAPSTSTALVSLDVKTIKTMPADVVINSWKDTVRDLGNVLVQVEGCTDKNGKEYQDGIDALCRILDSAVSIIIQLSCPSFLHV